VRCEQGVFGVDPTTLEQIDDAGYRVPKVLAAMRKALCENEGLKTEGIFRLAGEHSVISRLKAQLNNGTFSGSNDPASVASLIKVISSLYLSLNTHTHTHTHTHTLNTH
jgi:hypothetical protein